MALPERPLSINLPRRYLLGFIRSMACGHIGFSIGYLMYLCLRLTHIVGNWGL